MSGCKSLVELMDAGIAQAIMAEQLTSGIGAKKRRRERWPSAASTPGEVWRKLGDFRMWMNAIQNEFPKSSTAGKLVFQFQQILYFIAFPATKPE